MTSRTITTPAEADAAFGIGSELAMVFRAHYYRARGEIDPRDWIHGAVACSKFVTTYRGAERRYTQRVTFTMADGTTAECERWSMNGAWWSDWEATPPK